MTAGSDSAAKRELRMTPASSIRPRPVTWLWKDRIPVGEITLTPGVGGIGKSTFHAWLILSHKGGSCDGRVCTGSDRSRCYAKWWVSVDMSVGEFPRRFGLQRDLSAVFRAARGGFRLS